MGIRGLTVEERFWSKVDKDRIGTGCWEWRGRKYPNGYGGFTLKTDKEVYAHRVAYELVMGSIPQGKQLDHLCRNRDCVNPAHLEPVTQRENIMRGEGISIQCSRRTHCPQGHPLEGDNLLKWYLKKGWRKCKFCYNKRMNVYYHKHKGVVKS